MLRLIRICVILAVLWSGWWAAASAGLHYGLSHWFEARRTDGWQAEVGELSQHGFPFTLHSRLEDISVADPVTGVSVITPRLDLVAPAYWPGFVSAKLSDAPVEVATPTGRFILQSTNAQGDLRLHPGTALQLQSMEVVSDAWQISTADGDALSADDLGVTIVQDNSSPDTYQIGANAKNLTPGTLLRTLFALPPDWPVSFDSFTADVEVTFDTPWDRFALNKKRPQPRTMVLRDINASWGEVRIAASGDLIIDPSGIPTGEISLTLTNWRLMTQLAEAGGAFPSGQRGQLEIILSALANLGGGPDDLDLILSFQEGKMALGPIRLGPAPRLVLE